MSALSKMSEAGTGWNNPLLSRCLAAVFILAVVIGTRAAWFGDASATFDEQLYSFIGWRMTYGELPYADWWDRKPFGLFAIFALAHQIFGPEAIAYQIVAALFAAAGAGLTYLLARNVADRATSAIAAALSTLLIAYYGSHSGQSEVFFTPMILGMVWLLRDGDHPAFLRRSLLAMLIGGIALQVKYTVLPQCLFLGVYALWILWRRDKSIGNLLGAAAGFAVMGLLPTVLVGAFYLAVGEFDAFVFANFISFFDRLPSGGGRFSGSNHLFLLPLVFLAAIGIYGLLRLCPPSQRGKHWLILGWTLAALATVMLPSTIYAYYYASLVPPLVLLALPAYQRSGPMGLIPAAVLLIAAWFIVGIPARYDYSRNQQANLQSLVAAIAPHVNGEDKCLMVYDGPTVLYRLSGACVPSRFVYPDHLNNALERRALGVVQEEEVARILATQPGVIVTADRAVTSQNPASQAMVQAALGREYEETATIPIRGRNITAWVRRAD